MISAVSLPKGYNQATWTMEVIDACVRTYNTLWYFVGSTLAEIPYMFVTCFIFTSTYMGQFLAFALLTVDTAASYIDYFILANPRPSLHKMAQAGGVDADGGLEEPLGTPSTQLLLAEHHDRYQMLLKTFLPWKRRAQTQYERRKRVAAACRVGAIFCQRVYWHKWGEFIQERRKEDAAKSLLDEEKLPPQQEDLNSDGNGDEIKETIAVASEFDGEENDREKVAALAANGVVRIRSLHAIKRWRRFAQARRDRSVLEQRSYFFLYYWILKRSLSRLGQHALAKKRERALTVKIVRASRLRRLVKAMQQWRLRLQLHQTLALWRRYVWRRRHQALLYWPIADILTRKTHKRLLQRTVNVWEKQYTRNYAHRMLGRIIDRHFYRKVCEKAWRQWRSKVHQLTQLDSFLRGCQERRLRRLWRAWSERTRKKELQDQQRRRAVRAHYLSLLRMGYNGFRAWRAHRQLAYGRVETMLDAADDKILASAFSRWDHYTSQKKTRALKYERASRYVESRLLKHVWVNGFRCFFSRSLVKKRMVVAGQDHHYLRSVRRGFGAWKGVWQAERKRELTLDKMLQDYMTTRERSTKASVLENWAELTRAKAARRVVNAQVRGQAQRRLLRKYLSQWVAYVSVLRWQQITRARAEHHYKAVISRKCFKRWLHNVIVRRNYRKKTRAALIHWKLALQRKVFDGWKQYLRAKRLKQQRIHEALEFRHKHFVREGLRHWMTAALHLQEQREQRVTSAQASNTTHIWRRVAAIARHWRYLAVRRRTIREGRDVFEGQRDGPRQIQESVSWSNEHVQPGREQPRPSVVLRPGGRQTRHQGTILSGDSRVSGWTNERSPLSGFVMMPRNRPQPRRPLEVLLLSRAGVENMPQDNVNATAHETSRCGFDFPAEPFAPLTSPPHNQVKPSPVRARKKRQGAPPSNLAMSPRDDLLLPSTAARQLDALERQLVALSQRKREWKSFQNRLEDMREAANADPRLLTKLRAMEEQHAVRTKQWLHTKERIRSVAIEIQRLRSALQG